MINTKERPIALTVQEVNAVLAGDKTQHRVPFDFEFIKEANVPIVQKVADETNCTLSELVTGAYQDGSVYDFECPLGNVGDRLWVQEFHARREFNDPLIGTHYYADGPLTLDLRHDAGLLIKYAAENMPRWASRLLLEITDIRIERLNDISEQDAIAEGIKHIHADPKDRVGPNHFTKSNGWYHCSHPAAAEVFKEMYKVSDDHDKYGENPWVWVIEFKVVEPSEVQGG